MLDNKDVKIEIVDNGLVSLAKNLIRKGRISRNPIIRLSKKFRYCKKYTLYNKENYY